MFFDAISEFLFFECYIFLLFCAIFSHEKKKSHFTPLSLAYMSVFNSVILCPCPLQKNEFRKKCHIGVALKTTKVISVIIRIFILLSRSALISKVFKTVCPALILLGVSQ